MSIKTWFRNSIKPYLKTIKTWATNKITGDIAAAKTELRGEMASISASGTYRGAYATVAEMPTGGEVKIDDWAILTADDASNESGVYAKKASGWEYQADLSSAEEVNALIAAAFTGEISDAEAQEDFDGA